MSRQAGFQLENNFTKGLITEATGLNFPENACTDTYDCVFSEKGRATRRLGFDYETSNETDSYNLDDSVIVEYFWSAAGGDGATNIVVVQVAGTLQYYIAEEDTSLSSGRIADTTDLLARKVGSATDAEVKAAVCQFSSGNGYLFVVHPYCDPFYVEYTSPATVTETTITIETRDLEGDTSDADYNNIDTRPGSLSDAHEYNLYNQGWYQDVQDNGGNTVNALAEWDANRSDYPSMADIWWIYKDVNDQFNTSIIFRYALGNTPAPKGHYIFNEFLTTRSEITDIGTVTERSSGNSRPSAIAFFASRVWYAGVAASDYNQRIYYSQVLDSTDQFGKCYQLNDPTSEETPDLLPTDGGVIIIPDVGIVKKLFPMADSLLVFGTNGIWAITGSEGVGFKATDYSVRKISNIGTISPLSFVDVYGSPVWWNTDGIFTISNSEISGNEAVQALTDDTIKTFFLAIPSESKATVKGAFNPRSRIVQWVYSSTLPATIEEQYTYDRVLNFNILSKAFYPWTIQWNATSPRVNGIICYRGPTSEEGEILVESAADGQVTDSSGEDVVASGLTSLNAGYAFRYFTSDNVNASSWNCTWSQTINDSYLDWEEASEDIDYESYFYTGYKIHGDAIRFFENNYLTITMSNETNASCFIQGVWDYANSPLGARFTNAQQIYISRSLRNIQQTRKKIRGRGRSLQFKFYSETGKPFTIHGWSAWETQNASV